MQATLPIVRARSFGFALAALIAIGCGASKDPAAGDNELGGGDDSGSGGFNLDSGKGPGGGDGGGFDVASGEGSPGTDSTCAGTSSTATEIPLDLFIMQDQSGSMKEATSTGVSKWDAVKAAFKAFMDDPSNAGIGVGIQYFGLGSLFGFGGSSCNVSDYATPEVEIGVLPGIEAAIMGSLGAHSPSTDTPTAPALQGAISHAQSWKAAHPSHSVVAVLATDGLPTACDPTDIPSIAAFASASFKGTPSIPVYVIGVLADADLSKGADTNLNTISMAGNGNPAFIIKASSTDVASAFAKALAAIRGTALACTYEVPTGVGADYNKVNVVATLGGTSTTIPYVGSAAKCDPTTGGWYYDVDPSAGKPTKIIMCDATCKELSASGSGGKIDIEVGCATIGPK
jgi:hypothetical protein